MTARAVPFHCPYCADEDLRPHGERHGAWECRSCLRAFSLSFIGHLAHQTTSHPHGPTAEGTTTTVSPGDGTTGRRTP